MPKAPAKAPPSVHIKVTLNGIRPAIWRRLLVPVSTDLRRLHFLIMAAMGWDGDHMHAFEIGGVEYGDPEWMEDAEDEEKMTIRKLMGAGVSRFNYVYDFGDNWEHAVLIEKKAPPAGGPAGPLCVAGERACPPEDCGGPWRYEDLLEALKAPDSPARRERLEWLGGEFDPEEFSIEDVNARFKA